MRPTPTPRTSRFMGQLWPPSLLNGETWIESESFCYPNGGMTRRARALFPDGKLRVVRCGIPDTFFTVPCKGGGYLTNDTTGVLRFNPKPTPKESTHA